MNDLTKRGVLITLLVIAVIASVAWWNRIYIVLAAINFVSAPDVAQHRAVNWQQDLQEGDRCVSRSRVSGIAICLA